MSFNHLLYWVFPGGPLTVTDANLALGRLLPSFFPKIFGPGEDKPLSLEETLKQFHQLSQDINLFLSTSQPQAANVYCTIRMSRFLAASLYFCRFSFAGCCKQGKKIWQHCDGDECGGGCHGVHSSSQRGHVSANQSPDTGIVEIVENQVRALYLERAIKSPTSLHLLRLRVTIPLSTCWPVLAAQVANTPVL